MPDHPLRRPYTEALRVAAYQCDGDCGLDERACYDAHPITWSGMAGGQTHVDGAIDAIVDTVLAVHDTGLQRLEAALARVLVLADQIDEGAPWAAGATSTAARLRAAIITEAGADDE
ncbi:hypothetical protein ACFY97_18555 [Streptomyces klenkii]|uniref:hypothetical protein n=1 Tax=Streptomyces klenkii TaxID=1420899 RepID=UPI0036EEC3CE